MQKKTLTITNKLGLHTRAAAKLVDTAKKFSSKIQLSYHDRTVDCKSIMGVITLGAYKNSVIEVTLDGEDETLAFEEIEALVNNKFGED